MNTINLFCLPFAGGNKYSFREYEINAGASINVIPLEYPGRGARIKEPLLTNVHDMSDDIYNQIRQKINEAPYAIYGHSLGTLVSLMLTRKIVRNGDNLPVHLFVTGTTGPASYSKKARTRHLLPKSEFMKEVIDLEGSPEGVLDHPELVDYYEPILRADFKAAETFTYDENVLPDLPLTVMTGTNERYTTEDIQTWQNETTWPAVFYKLPGGHFFILNNAAVIMKIISEKLLAPDKMNLLH
jgi:surfactin synthase thioesterase subunit